MGVSGLCSGSYAVQTSNRRSIFKQVPVGIQKTKRKTTNIQIRRKIISENKNEETNHKKENDEMKADSHLHYLIRLYRHRSAVLRPDFRLAGAVRRGGGRPAGGWQRWAAPSSTW